MTSAERRRVEFRAPVRLIERADALAKVLGDDRTTVLIEALREYLHSVAHDDQLKQEIAGAYYDDGISFDELETLVGRADAESIRVLKQQLDEDYVEELAGL